MLRARFVLLAVILPPTLLPAGEPPPVSALHTENPAPQLLKRVRRGKVYDPAFTRRMEFLEFRYNDIFETEARAEATLLDSGVDRWQFSFHPADNNFTPSLKGRSGNAYRVESVLPEIRVRDDSVFIIADQREKTAWIFQCPEDEGRPAYPRSFDPTSTSPPPGVSSQPF